ncbi:VOC family protein [Micromonospora zamorensis]|uniref:VOC family protein n=1 Tax=Micromonospora zamorensis TaxID=709883 RepID=UPI0033F38AC1
MAATKVRLDHCVIAVSDWERSTDFYRDVLGVGRKASRGARGKWLQAPAPDGQGDRAG